MQQTGEESHKHRSDPSDAPPVVTELDQLTAASVTCARCGYALRGLGTDAACPECALPVSITLAGDLRASTTNWRRLFAVALTLLALQFGLQTITGMIGAAFRLGLLETSRFDSDSLFFIIWPVTAWTGIAIGIAAYWLITMPPTRTFAAGLSVRRLGRITMNVGFAFIIGGALLGYRASPATALSLQALANVAFVVGILLVTAHVARLARQLECGVLAPGTWIVGLLAAMKSFLVTMHLAVASLTFGIATPWSRFGDLVYRVEEIAAYGAILLGPAITVILTVVLFIARVAFQRSLARLDGSPPEWETGPGRET